MKVHVILFIVGMAIVAAQQTPTKTRSGLPPSRRFAPRRNDWKDVPDNSGGRAPQRRGPVQRVASIPTAVRRGPPPPLYRTAPAPAPAPAPFAQVPARRVLPPTRNIGAGLPQQVPSQRVAVPPVTRTKSAGFLGGPLPYVPPANPMYPPTTVPPPPPTTRYYSYDTPDVNKKEEEEEEG